MRVTFGLVGTVWIGLFGSIHGQPALPPVVSATAAAIVPAAAASCTARPVDPPGRWFTQLVYDSARRVTLMYGGEFGLEPASGASAGDTWTWDGVAWTQASPASSPPYANSESLAYDEKRKLAVLVEGSAMWTWDGSDWTSRKSDHAPLPRGGETMTYDPDLGGIVLFGGGAQNTLFSDTWLWDGSDWTELAGNLFPAAPEVWAAMAYHAASHSLVLAVNHGRSAVDTYVFTDGGWKLQSVPPLVGSGQARLVADDALGVLVYVDARTNAYHTWDGHSWTARDPAGVDLDRIWPGMAYDAHRQRVVLFGGLNSTRTCALSDTLLWDGAWSRWPPDPAPSRPSTQVVGPWPDWSGSLWGIADHLTGDGSRWPELYAANRDVIGGHPGLIYPGTTLVVPAGW